MNDLGRSAGVVASNKSGAGNFGTRHFSGDFETRQSQEPSSTNAGLNDFPDLSDFVNQRMEDDLNELFADRYTMANKLYKEVANGFPDPVVVYPWNKRPERKFDYIDKQRSWEGCSKRSAGSEWQSSWSRNVTVERKRRNPTSDPIRIFYPNKKNRK